MKKIVSIAVVSLLVIVGFIGFLRENASADTWVEGHITVDTTWTLANSPYVVSGDVYVDEDVTLTIDAGVTVKFGGAFSIIIDGNLSAIGTDADKITFTSNKLSPAPEDYVGLLFNGKMKSSIELEYSKVEFATTGLDIRGNVGQYTIENCIFHNNSDGIRITMDNNTIGVINRNDISSNLNYGLCVDTHGDDRTIKFATITNNTFSNNSDAGICLKARDGGGSIMSHHSYVYNTTISSNHIISNKHGIFVHGYGGSCGGAYASTKGYGSVYFTNIKNNTIAYNKQNGIYIKGHGYGCGPNPWGYYGWGFGYVYDTTISQNIIYKNGGDGVNATTYKVDSGSFGSHGYVDGLSIEDNKIFNNAQKGISIFGSDTTIKNTGIYNNSIAYHEDSVGVSFKNAKNNIANFNDIYANGYGMTVSTGANVNAEQNYWGDASGPYHESMNPTGEGNSVNGDGTDLDFVPFLTSPVSAINERPVAHLVADKYIAGSNEDVTFDASGSTDDTIVIEYYFDYGDGANTSWVTTSVVKHKYSSWGTYNVSLVVRDEYRVESINEAKVTITVKQNEPPVLSDGTVSPSSGDINNVFYFNVTYSDPEGSSPVMKNVHISGTPHDMSWISGSHTTGALYSYHTTLSEGSYTYYFVFNDSVATTRLPTSGSYSGPVVSEVDTIPPSIANMQPSNGSTTDDNTPVISASYSDASGIDITSVILKVDDVDVTSFATITTSSATYTPTVALAEGSHSIYLEVRDSSTNQNKATRTWFFTVIPVENQPPICYISSPSSGATVSGTCTVSGSAIDYDGYIQEVEIKIGSGSWVQVSGTTSWSYNWDTTKESKGQYTIYARSYDGIEYSTEQSRSVTVDNKEGKEEWQSIITDFFLKFPYLGIILLIVVVAIAGIGIGISKRKKRKKEQPTKTEKVSKEKDENE